MVRASAPACAEMRMPCLTSSGVALGRGEMAERKYLSTPLARRLPVDAPLLGGALAVFTEAAPLRDPHQPLDLVRGERHTRWSGRPAGVEAAHAGLHVVDVVVRRQVDVQRDAIGAHVGVV